MNTRPADYESAALPTELFQHTSMRSRLLTVLCLLLGRKSALPNFPPLATTSDLLITNQLLYRLSYTSIFNSKVLPANLNNGYDTTFFPHRQQKFMLPSSIHTAVVYITICIFAGILAFFRPAFFAFSTSFDRLFLSMTKNNKILLDRFLQKLYPFPKFQLFFWGLSAVLSLRNFL